MNPLNYGSLEASKRLVENGIVLETECKYLPGGILTYGSYDNYELVKIKISENFIPAPSMEDVWRELPEGTDMYKKDSGMSAMFWNGATTSPSFFSFNPTDALIDLLIWTKKQNKDK